MKEDGIDAHAIFKQKDVIEEKNKLEQTLFQLKTTLSDEKLQLSEEEKKEDAAAEGGELWQSVQKIRFVRSISGLKLITSSLTRVVTTG